tara:strand:+ start:169 stop:327 length:159 start_codon:yes stop_codon:yes gene_type:complete
LLWLTHCPKKNTFSAFFRAENKGTLNIDKKTEETGKSHCFESSTQKENKITR